jgi:hypothetical protein
LGIEQLLKHCEKKTYSQNESDWKWLSTSNKILIYLWNTKVGYGFHLKHRNHRTLSIYSFAHDCRRILVRAEYGHPKGSPNSNS